MKLNISFDRKGNLSHIKQLIKKHFLAQNYFLVFESDKKMTFQKGTLLNRWITFNPIKWKITFDIHIETKNDIHHITATFKRLTLTKDEIQQGENYWQAEINSFRRAVLSEEIIADENSHLTNGKIGKDSFRILGLVILYLSTIFPPLIIINYLFGFPKHDISFPYITLSILALHLYYFRYRYFILVLCSSPLILSTILRRLEFLTKDDNIGEIVIAFTLIVIFLNKRLFLQDALNLCGDYNYYFIHRYKRIKDVGDNDFLLIKDYQLYKNYRKEPSYNLSKISYKELLMTKIGLDNLVANEFINETIQLSYTEEVVNWNEIIDVSLDKTKKVLLVEFKTGKILELLSNYEGWYILVQQIPEKFTNFDRKYIYAMFESFELCKICGVYAFEKEKDICHCCGYKSWKEEWKEDYTDENTYLKYAQTQFFSDYWQDNKIDFELFRKDLVFKFVDNWQPMTNEQEIIAYLKQ